MKKHSFLLCALLLCTQTGRSQQLSATSLMLTGPQNSQEVGGVGSAGDSSCPSLSSLLTGQYAICYLQADGALELGYPNGTYSPMARMSDLQSAQASMATQITNLAQQVSTLQAQVSTLSTTVMQQAQSSSVSSVLDVVLTGAQLAPGSFQPVPLATVNVDTASAFDRASSSYVIPSSGYYLTITKLRFEDGLPANVNYGQSAGTHLVDDPEFTWSTTSLNAQGTYSRNSSINMSVKRYNQGDRVIMYTYLDYQTLLPVTWAAMTLIKMGN